MTPWDENGLNLHVNLFIYLIFKTYKYFSVQLPTWFDWHGACFGWGKKGTAKEGRQIRLRRPA